MRAIWTSSIAAVSFCAVLLATAPASADVTQSVDRSSTVRSTAMVKSKATETKPVATKAVSTTVATVAKKEKDRPGKRFWSRIMEHFREIHSADKKLK